MDMNQTIVPKSDQLNADDLLCGPITITITDVKVRAGQEQPVSIFYEGDNGKPYKACKSMCRVMVSAWGPDAAKYVGRSLTLYCDPKVKWGGMEVGGIRISHMSDIDSSITMALTVTRANKKPFTVRPIEANGTKTAASQNDADKPTPSASEPPHSATAAATISPEEALALEARCQENGIQLAKVKKAFGVERLSAMTGEQLAQAHEMIDTTIAKRKVTA